MPLYVTYCSKDKSRDEERIPAISRYSSARIEKIRELAEKRDQKFAILSGKYGILQPQQKIPFYDKLLTDEDLGKTVPKVEKQLEELNPDQVVYFTKEVSGQRIAYFELIRRACESIGTEFEKRRI